jgi:hypothetical protein
MEMRFFSVSLFGPASCELLVGRHEDHAKTSPAKEGIKGKRVESQEFINATVRIYSRFVSILCLSLS